MSSVLRSRPDFAHLVGIGLGFIKFPPVSCLVTGE